MEERPNRSNTYIIPLLYQYIEFNKNALINSYLYDINNPDLNVPNIRGILMMFKWKDNDTTKLKSSSYLEKKYDIDGDKFMVYIRFPLDIAKEIKLILDGKYSQLSKTSKANIVAYWSNRDTKKLYNILHKNEKYKQQLEEDLGIKLPFDAELGSILDLHEETYSKIIKLPELK